MCKWSLEYKFCAAHGLHFKNIPGCCRPNLNMNLFWPVSLKKKKKESLKEVFDVSKVMISLKFTHKIKPQKLYLNDVYLLENYKVITSPCNRMRVCGIWESVNGKKIPNMFLLLRWKEQFSLICSLCSLNGQKSIKCAKGYFIH